jgi:DNA-binding NtrC family response regulator
MSKNELDGVIERLLEAGITLPEAIGILERGMIEGALRRADGNQCATAKKLEIHRNTLQRKMTEYGLGNVRRRPGKKPPVQAGRARKRKLGVA